MTVVTLKNVTKTFANKVALCGLDFETQDGEFFVLLGPSGAGKTTTLNVIAGLEEPDTGEILFDGQPMNALPPNQRNVGVAFENYALYPHFTVFKNLSNPLTSPGETHTKGEIAKKVLHIAQMLKIDHLLERYPAELSGGQKQRVALGRSMIGEPALYLLDEPLTHLDAKIRYNLRLEFHRLEALQNKTTIYVTHDYVEALSLGDRIAILNDGQIEQIGPPKAIYYRPKNMFVARTVGQPSISLLAGILESGQEGAYLLIPEGHFKIPISARLLKSLEQVNAPREMTIGVRPQDILLRPLADSQIQAEWDVFEPFGIFGVLSAKLSNLYIKVLVDLEIPVASEGTPIGLEFKEDRLLFFDPNTQHNLLWSKE